ncbi:MAG: N-acetyl-gamma-glutamyl-phosphate reductase [Lachnospiraceae bacterium]|nr:N-acetyl-gamma-glutamyl-phosphate reductase [Lachnospiraceae bacterium]
MAKIKAAIIGVTGYAGAEVARLLQTHPETELVWYGSRSFAGQRFSDIFGNFRSFAEETLQGEALEEAAEAADVVFCATPQGYCASSLTEEILKKTKIIDLSADFRLKDVAVYEQWYGLTHASPQFLEEAVYGLPELHREHIRGARLIANPGCYTTCAILTCAPALREGLLDPDTLIVDAMSGVSGAGRGAKTANLFSEVNESAKPYGVTNHRHTPEIEAELSLVAGKALKLTFTPHLVPMNRGILATCYATLTKNVTAREVREKYLACYGAEPFVRVLPEGQFPETRFVEHSNLLDIQVAVDERTNRLILTGALDNLVKGAAGQAVQNMNLLFGLAEETGLQSVPSVP